MAQRDILDAAVSEAQKMKNAALANAKNVLVEQMSSELKAAVQGSIEEELGGGGDPPSDYDEAGEQERVGEEVPVAGDKPANTDLADEGDGPAVVEASIEDEEDDLGEDIDLELEDDFDLDDDDDDDDEVIEIVDDEEDDDDGAGEDIDIDVPNDDFDIDDDEEDEEEDECAMDYEAAVKEKVRENKKLQKEIASLKSSVVKRDKAIGIMHSTIKEVNLFNARLAGATEVMRRVSLTPEERERIVERFDDCESVKEVKRAYKAIVEGFRVASRRKHKVNRKGHAAPSTETITESKTHWDRQKELANLT